MPNYYNPYQYQYSQNIYQPQQQMQIPGQQPQAQPQTQPQIQNGGFVSVRNEVEAMNYPVAPGNSVTFKDETAPYVYTKTMGFSQLDRPIFEKYKLVKEEVTEQSNLPQNAHETLQADISTINELKGEIATIWKEIDSIKERNVSTSKKSSAKKEKEIEDDAES